MLQKRSEIFVLDRPSCLEKLKAGNYPDYKIPDLPTDLSPMRKYTYPELSMIRLKLHGDSAALV